MDVSIYLDESGDLGWKFDLPYRQGGSSRYLTIAAILIQHDQRKDLKRLMRKLYEKTKTPTHDEVKWAHLDMKQRLWIAQRLLDLKSKHGADIQYYSISVRKEKVKPHIRNDANKLYNYMIKLMLSEEMAIYDQVFFNVDQRSIKVESGNSLHDYLQTVLWMEQSASTILKTRQCNSKDDLGVQLSDILSGIIQSHFEDGKSDPYHVLSNIGKFKKLYF